MPVIDATAILNTFREETQRTIELGFTQERKRLYRSLLPDSADPLLDENAFKVAINGLLLSDDEVALIRRHLDSADPR